jgi:hypothetical protein
MRILPNFGSGILFLTYYELNQYSEKISNQILLIFIFFENILRDFVNPLENFVLFKHVAAN